MKQKPPKSVRLNVTEQQLVERLRAHPQIRERVQAILDMASSSGKSADEIEELLIAEIQRLGNATMESWAARTEEKLVQELKQKDPLAKVRKKKR